MQYTMHREIKARGKICLLARLNPALSNHNQYLDSGLSVRNYAKMSQIYHHIKYLQYIILIYLVYTLKM